MHLATLALMATIAMAAPSSLQGRWLWDTTRMPTACVGICSASQNIQVGTCTSTNANGCSEVCNNTVLKNVQLCQECIGLSEYAMEASVTVNAYLDVCEPILSGKSTGTGSSVDGTIPAACSSQCNGVDVDKDYKVCSTGSENSCQFCKADAFTACALCVTNQGNAELGKGITTVGKDACASYASTSTGSGSTGNENTGSSTNANTNTNGNTNTDTSANASTSAGGTTKKSKAARSGASALFIVAAAAGTLLL